MPVDEENQNKIACFKVKLNLTRGSFSFFHPKVKVQERGVLGQSFDTK